jgi:hypothetical protein
MSGQIDAVDYDSMLNTIEAANDAQLSFVRSKLQFDCHSSWREEKEINCFDRLLPLDDTFEPPTVQAASPQSVTSVSPCESDPLVIGAYNIETMSYHLFNQSEGNHSQLVHNLELSPLPTLAPQAPVMGSHFEEFLEPYTCDANSFFTSTTLDLTSLDKLQGFDTQIIQPTVPISQQALSMGIEETSPTQTTTATATILDADRINGDVKPEAHVNHEAPSRTKRRASSTNSSTAAAVKKQAHFRATKLPQTSKRKSTRVDSRKGSESVVPRTPRRVPETVEAVGSVSNDAPALTDDVDCSDDQWVDSDSNVTSRSSTPTIDAGAGRSKEEERWPLDVLEGSIENLRTYARRNYLSLEDIASLKADRRRFKGRQYSSASRMSKKVLLDELQKARNIIEKREASIRSLKSKAENERRLVHAYRKILGDLKVQDPYKSQ